MRRIVHRVCISFLIRRDVTLLRVEINIENVLHIKAKAEIHIGLCDIYYII